MICVPAEKLYDVAAVFTIVGFGVGWFVGVISGFVAVRRNPAILVKLMR
jgi:hypothetical protein